MVKGLSQTMWIVVAALVILVVALVVLSIFTKSAGNVGVLAEFRKNCELNARATCASLNTMPIDWEIPKPFGKDSNNNIIVKSCADELGRSSSQFGCGTGTPAGTSGPVVA